MHEIVATLLCEALVIITMLLGAWVILEVRY